VILATTASAIGSATSWSARWGRKQFRRVATRCDTRGSLAAAEATLLGALAHRESRGRTSAANFPELSPELRVNFQARVDAAGHLRIDAPTVPPVRSSWRAGHRRART
jgi:hypothetical protein